MVNLLVFGQTGQVTRELARRAPLWATLRQLSRSDVSLENPAACADAILDAKVDAVINAAAWTAVDKAETEELAATVVNGDTPAAMARACALSRIPFLHLSTDYVFDGAGIVPFHPDDPTAPLGAYGRSKLKAEQGIQAAGGHHLILRTSWVVSAHGTNFVKTMLRLGRERPSLNVVADQIGGPTPASAIADALYICTAAMVNGSVGGIHHFAGTPDTSWADFARAIMIAANLPCQITDIASAAYPTPARRPLNSRLDCNSLHKAFGIPRPDWQAGLFDMIKDLETA